MMGAMPNLKELKDLHDAVYQQWNASVGEDEWLLDFSNDNEYLPQSKALIEKTINKCTLYIICQCNEAKEFEQRDLSILARMSTVSLEIIQNYSGFKSESKIGDSTWQVFVSKIKEHYQNYLRLSAALTDIECKQQLLSFFIPSVMKTIGIDMTPYLVSVEVPPVIAKSEPQRPKAPLGFITDAPKESGSTVVALPTASLLKRQSLKKESSSFVPIRPAGSAVVRAEALQQLDSQQQSQTMSSKPKPRKTGKLEKLNIEPDKASSRFRFS